MSEVRRGGEVSSLALPVLLGFLPDSVVSLVSLVVASRMATEVVAATGLASYLFFILNAVSSVFMVGLLVFCSQAYGAGRVDLVERATGELVTVAVALSLGVVATSTLWVGGYVDVLSGGQVSVGRVATTYLSYRLASVPAMMVGSVLASSYRAANSPWVPTYSSLVAGASGVVLIPSLGLGYLGLPRMGVVGMGLASAVSQYVGLAVYTLFKPPFRVRPAPPSAITLKVLAIGVPASIERLVGSVGQNIYINAVARSGVEALAAHNIGISVESLVINPVFAVSIAASARVGQRVGSSDLGRVDELTRESLRVGLSWMSVATAVLLALAPFAGRFFTESEAVARLVAAYLVLAAVSEIGFGGSLAIYGVMRGLGSTWAPLVVNSLTVLVLRAALAQLLQPYYGVYGVWFTQVTDMYGRFAIAYLLYRRLKSRLVVRLVN